MTRVGGAGVLRRDKTGGGTVMFGGIRAAGTERTTFGEAEIAAASVDSFSGDVGNGMGREGLETCCALLVGWLISERARDLTGLKIGPPFSVT